MKGIQDFGYFGKSNKTKQNPSENAQENASKLVKKYQNTERYFTAVQNLQETNFGLNPPNKAGIPVLKGIDFETDQILQALHIYPDSIQIVPSLPKNN